MMPLMPLMPLTDYYRMVKLPDCKSKFRYDCIASTGSYAPFEERARRSRNRRFKFYYSNIPDTFTAKAQRQAAGVITDGESISSVFTPPNYSPFLGYGDTKGTNDALLFLFSDDNREIEVFVARGFKNRALGVFVLYANGELIDDIERLRAQAKPTSARPLTGRQIKM